jgi:voltage-gated potassium channel
MLMFVLLYHRLQAGLRRSWADSVFRSLVVLMSAIWGIGTVFYHHVEGWNWIDSFYFCVVTSATVGFGDFTPQTILGKLFTIGYILVSVGLFVSLAGTLGVNLVRVHPEEKAD